MKKRITLILLILAVLGAGGYFGYQYYQQNLQSNTTTYQTEPAARGRLTAMVGGTGTVRANQSSTINWQTSGRIGTITVGLDDRVKKDQKLAELESSSLMQTIILARADLVEAKKSLEKVRNSLVAKAQAQLTLAQARQAVKDAQEKRENKNYKRASDATLDSARAKYYLSLSAVSEAENNYSALASLPEDNSGRAGALAALANTRTQRDRALAQLNWLLGKPDGLEIAQADAELELAQARLKDAEREWTRVQNGINSDDVAAAEARVAAIQATLDMTTLIAPFSGTITEVKPKIGDQVSLGTTSFRVDDLTILLVDVQITEVDINRIQVGQPVSLSFDAIQGKEYNGRVTQVARVGSPQSGVVNFSVTIEMVDPDSRVKPGMTAAANIVVSQLEQVLLVPNRAVRLRDGQRVIYLLVDGQALLINIQIGSTSDNYSEVTSGDMKEGDLIILNPPMIIGPMTGPPIQR